MSTRNSFFLVLLIGSFGVLAANAIAQEAKPAAGKEAAAKPRIVIADVVEMKTKVDAVDQAKRLVTLTTPDGETVTVKAGPAVKNLDQVKAGDELVVKAYESIALFVRKGSEAPSASETMAVAVAAKGQEPGAVIVDSQEIKATVEAVHPALRKITLKGPDGKKRTFKVHEDYKALGEIKKGDELVVRHTEALAISIEKGK
jgi:hypothetical protein